MKITHLLRILLASILSLSIIGCNDDDNSSGSLNAPSSMAGATVSFNPTIEFVDGTTFNYTNDEAGSPFAPGPINGTYTYTATGTTAQVVLTAVGSDIGGTDVDSLTINLSNFVGSATSITAFTVTVDGNTYSDGAVTSGTLVPKPRATGGGGLPSGNNIEPATIVPTLVGTYTLDFLGAFGGEPPAGSPYQNGDTVTFEITADGKLIFEGRTLDAPFFQAGNEAEVIWYDGTFSYAASTSFIDESLNEINIGQGYDYYTAGAFTFLGQFSNK